MNYALIENEIVMNIIVLDERNLKDFPKAVPTNDRLVMLGDTYDGVDFYRDGEKVLTLMQYAELRVAEAERALAILIGNEVNE